ncbi:hypothetical protein A2U01_0036425, partial [Trifolium medium]|nr:hypothetical protein [Trifolium medium]
VRRVASTTAKHSSPTTALLLQHPNSFKHVDVVGGGVTSGFALRITSFSRLSVLFLLLGVSASRFDLVVLNPSSCSESVA